MEVLLRDIFIFTEPTKIPPLFLIYDFFARFWEPCFLLKANTFS